MHIKNKVESCICLALHVLEIEQQWINTFVGIEQCNSMDKYIVQMDVNIQQEKWLYSMCTPYRCPGKAVIRELLESSTHEYIIVALKLDMELLVEDTMMI